MNKSSEESTTKTATSKEGEKASTPPQGVAEGGAAAGVDPASRLPDSSSDKTSGGESDAGSSRASGTWSNPASSTLDDSEPPQEAPADATVAGDPSQRAAQPEASSSQEAEETTATEELTRVRDQLLRTAADFDNFRKRSRKEVADAEKQGRSELLRELLPVFDNLERAAAHASSATEVKALADGIDLVMRQFLDTLSRIGIERIETVAKPFDPSVHEAIQHLQTSEHAPGTVAAEVQAGYRMGDRLVRPAMVVVAKAPSQ